MGPYVHGTRAGNTIYISGALAIDQDGNVAHPGDIEAQTRHVLEQIKSVIEAAGGAMTDIAYNMVFISDVKYYAEVNKVYSEYFPNPPARYCLVTQLVKDDFLVEISSVAHIGEP